MISGVHSGCDRAMQRKIVILGADTAALQRVVPILRRSEVTVERWEYPATWLQQLREHSCTLVIARFPVAGVGLGDLVTAMREAPSATTAASLLLLADAESTADVAAYLGRGVNRVISLDAPSDRLLLAVADLMAVSPRRDLRVLVQLNLRLEGATERMLAMTSNLSVSGMLVEGSRNLAVASQVTFELDLPDPGGVVRGVAEVIRHSGQRDRTVGMGMRFLSFEGDGQHRLERYLESG